MVTGASSGIGRALAVILAQHGYDLAVVARRTVRLQELRTELEAAYGISVQPLPTDLNDAAARERAVAAVNGRVDVLVNGAGFGNSGPFAEISWPDTASLLRVNVEAVMHLTRMFLPGMIEQGRGRILNVASTAAYLPGPFMAAYYASKAFVDSWSEALAEEVRGTGVTVTCLSPGLTRTEFHAQAHMPVSAARRLGFMDAATVARVGYDGMMRGERVVVPGLFNRLTRHIMAIVPRGVLLRTIRRIHRH